MKVRKDHIEQLGGVEAIMTRVAAFKQAIEAHKGTVNMPAPAESGLIEMLARSGEAIEPVEAPPGSAPSIIEVDAVNRAFQSLTNRVQELERRMDAAGK